MKACIVLAHAMVTMEKQTDCIVENMAILDFGFTCMSEILIIYVGDSSM